MFAIQDLFRDDPPERVVSRSRPRVAWARLASITGAALCLAMALALTAQAQPPRTDPGDPPNPGGSGDGWQVLTIPGLPAGAVLGDVWASPVGDVYVWAKYPPASAGIVSPADEPGDGERLPNPPGGGPKLWSSRLYRYDGRAWTVSLQTPNEMAVALYGSGDHVYVSTTSQAGEVHVYSFNGTSWSREFVPGYNLGRLHTFAGVPGDLYLKVDRVVKHNTGAGFYSEYELPGDEPPVRGLVYTDALHLFVLCPSGQYILDTGTWTPCDETFSFSDVQDAWGMREASGALQLYAVGSNKNDDGLFIWRYTETDPIAHTGRWATVASDPAVTGVPGIGHGQHIWGSAGNDIYATGVVAGKGEMLRFDGFGWMPLYPPVELGAIHGVSGNGDGVVWFTAENGQVIRYQRPEPPRIAPIVESTAPVPLQTEVSHGALNVRYALTATTPVQLGVYDVMGRQLGTIDDGIRAPGTHEASWNLGSFDSGIYFVKLRTKGAAFTRRVVVIR